MIYKTELTNNFNEYDFTRAKNKMINKYGKKTTVTLKKTPKSVTIVFDGHLGAALCYLEYLLESEIILDQYHYIIQNGNKTDTQLEIVGDEK